MENEVVRGYKVFNSDWTCRGFQYEVGKTYTMEESPKCCEVGFHFCEKLADCFDYYDFDSKNKVAEIEALGEIVTIDNKSCTNSIRIIREITWNQVLNIVNTGDWNTGSCNTGNRNTGDWNTGSCNTGDWNTTSHSSGLFNTEEEKIRIFNKSSNWSYKDWTLSEARILLNEIDRNVVEWVYKEDMEEQEKKENPTYKTTGGYLKVLDESECVQMWWNGLTEDEKDIIRNLPNFDNTIFEHITGIKTGFDEEE